MDLHYVRHGKTPSVHWNEQVRLVLSDVDETIADVYTPAEPAMAAKLSSLLRDGKQHLHHGLLEFLQSRHAGN